MPVALSRTSAGTILKSGYNTTMAAGAGNVAVPAANMPATCPATTGTTYLAGSRPANPGSTGTRSFGTDQRATIYQDNAGAVFTAATVAAATMALQ